MTIDNFFKAYAYGLSTGDAGPYKGVYTDKCSKCDAILVNIEQASTPGTKVSGGKFEYSRLVLLNSTDARRAVWRVDLTQEETTFTFSDGSTTKLEGFDGPVFIEVVLDAPIRVSGIDSRGVE
ncbi:DUF6318 family protein [Sanguibacter sp. A247]|uniref:DUF6318 family protein n=1 Tax=unclassified Sanguibacter TaxID=2645534 RepID=UPI003FD76F14